MTYVKSTCTSVKICAALFWGSALLLSIFFVPVYSISLALLALFHFAYLTFEPIPVPIVLGFVVITSLALYIAFLNTIHIS